MNHESQADKAREFQDAQAIDASYSERPFSDLMDTPTVKAKHAADEAFHANLKRQAAEKARARKLPKRAEVTPKARRLAVILATLGELE